MIDKFVTADEHYGHRNIIVFCKRPFTDIDDMREKLIAAHNSKVPKGGLTYHIGDMFWRTLSVDAALDIIDRLNGQHIFVYGNHDELIEGSAVLRKKFLKVSERLVLDKTEITPKIVLDHYAGRVWKNSHNGSWQLYGHSHGELTEVNSLSFDVGVDTRPDISPWSFEEIAEKMKAKSAAGACDPMAEKIAKEPWPKMPIIPTEVWTALKEQERIVESCTGACSHLPVRRCVE